jgi:hypothetical protein
MKVLYGQPMHHEIFYSTYLANSLVCVLHFFSSEKNKKINERFLFPNSHCKAKAKE